VTNPDNAPPAYLNPFVLPVPDVTIEASDIDRYVPEADGPVPAVVLVHGGPITPEIKPRDWPVFVGYGSLLAAAGVMGVMFDHPLYSATHYAESAERIATVVARVRADQRVDPDRIALWFFSGGGPLLADYLRQPPHWLRCLAATYPLLDMPAEWGVDPRFRPIEAAAEYRGRMVLTRVGLERPMFAEAVETFLAAVSEQAQVMVVDVPNGHHGFDHRDDTDESRDAVLAALAAVVGALTTVD
jgi:dienelactone hydrolase